MADSVYAYDNAGEVTSIKTTSNTLATDTQCFAYDHLQDLTSAWTPASNSCTAPPSSTTLGGPAPYWTDYAVDPQTGNRLSTIEHAITGTGTSTTDTYSYPAAAGAHPHAVQSVTHAGGSTGTSSYGYDADGDTTTRPGQTLGYDSAARLSSVTAGSASQSDVYDASGTLLLQTDSVNGSTLFMGDTELHIATGASTASAVRTYSVNGVPVAERSTTVGVSGSKLTWLVADAQGTVKMQVDAVTGAATVRQQDPFGLARGGSSPSWADGHGFLNAATSATMGLTQLGARAYDATLGRFLSVDAVLAPFNPVQNNGYAYSGSSPVTSADPSGDCYESSTGALTHQTNCAGGHGANKASATTLADAKSGGKHGPAAAGVRQSKTMGSGPSPSPSPQAAPVPATPAMIKLGNEEQASRWQSFGLNVAIGALFACSYVAPEACFEDMEAEDEALANVEEEIAADEAAIAEEEAAAASGPGVWESTNESMSARAANYQSQITGADAGSVYKVNGVKFDGFDDGVLQDAKGPGYANFVSDGQFKPWYNGADSLASQAQRQVVAAGGTPITWSVAEAPAATAINNLFAARGITGINVVYVPAR